jgi:DNA adenine methylase
MNFYTPLRYPGGKARLGPWLAEALRHNRISNGSYAEPYAGGAGAAMFLLLRGYVKNIHINDVDPVVHSFWHAAIRNSSRLVKLVKETKVDMKSWEEQQEIMANQHRYSHLRVGFATFFLNRTNRSGILAGGVIGGKGQTGNFKLDARYNKDELINRLQAINEMRRSISLTGMDASEWLSNVAPDLPPTSLIYLDPPYFVKGSLLYRNFYAPEDHAAIAQKALAINTPLLVTYDDVPEIRALYSKASAVNFSMKYSTHSDRVDSTEVMFYSNMTLPFNPQLTRGSHLPPTSLNKATNVVPHGVR